MKNLNDYKAFLEEEELSENTISKYLYEVEQLYKYLNDEEKEEVTKTDIINYKKYLKEKFAVSTVNNKIVCINKYLSFLNNDNLKVKFLRQQTNNTLDNVLTENDFDRIVRQAQKKGTSRDYIMLHAFYYTGLRVSELEFLTVEALKKGYITVENKGKIRQVPICDKLSKMLKDYVKENGITQGSIIVNKNNEPLSRSYIFKRMKYLAGQAKVKKANVYPHSIRHLFATQYLANNNNNIMQLADILGHSSLETTRIYTKLSTDELKKTINF